MNILPIENLIYSSNLTPEEIRKRILEAIEPVKAIRISNKNSTPYEGFMKDNTFVIKRIVKGRNSFRPKITGKIDSTSNGSEIRVKMRLNLAVLIFLIFWSSCIVFISLISIDFSSRLELLLQEFLFPAGMLTFGLLLTVGGFKFESNRSKKDLENILEAKLK